MFATMLVVVLAAVKKYLTEVTKGRRVYFCSQFRGTLHSSEEITAAEE